MLIGIIGHSRTIGLIRDLVRAIDPTVDVMPCVMESMDLEPAITFIRTTEDHLDGILFTGPIPYDLVNSAMISHKPWVCAGRDDACLLAALARAAVMNGRDIRRLSVDSVGEAALKDACRNFGHTPEDLALHLYSGDIFAENFLEDLLAFHRSNHDRGAASVCLTAVSSVYEELTALGIPCLVLDPGIDSVRSALALLAEKKRSQLGEGSRLVVLAVEQDLPDGHALVRENEYMMALETMKITEEIYLFAQRIQAAVVEREFGRFLLFTTRNLLEFETGNLRRLSLLEPQRGLRFGTLSVGVGYGETAREAKYNAGLGLLRAKKNGGGRAFIVENGASRGPILPGDGQSAQEPPAHQIDGRFQRAADLAGLSLNTILKLQWILDREQTATFTARELAAHFDVSLRSMHRMLEKLERAGFLSVIGRNVRTEKGRPSRVVQLDLKKDSERQRIRR